MLTQFRLLDKILRNAIKVERSISQMKKHAQMLANRIKVRTRLGFGVSGNNALREKLKRLSPNYIKQRQGKLQVFTLGKGPKRRTIFIEGKKSKKAKRPPLSSATTPSKSNLTRTGQMLDNIKGNSNKFGKAQIDIKGGRKAENLSNKEVAEFVTANGRPFFYLSKPEINGLKNEIAKNIKNRVERSIKQAFKK